MFYVNVCEMLYDVVLITETWLDASHTSYEYFPPNYNVIRCDRKFSEVGRSTGGGVLVALSKNILFSVVETSVLTNITPLIDIVICDCHLNTTSFLIANFTFLRISLRMRLIHFWKL